MVMGESNATESTNPALPRLDPHRVHAAPSMTQRQLEIRRHSLCLLDLIRGVSNQLRGFRRFKDSQLADMVGHPAWKSGIEDLIRKYRWFSN